MNLRNCFKNTKKSEEKDAVCKAGGSYLMKHDGEDFSDKRTLEQGTGRSETERL